MVPNILPEPDGPGYFLGLVEVELVLEHVHAGDVDGEPVRSVVFLVCVDGAEFPVPDAQVVAFHEGDFVFVGVSQYFLLLGGAGVPLRLGEAVYPVVVAGVG